MAVAVFPNLTGSFFRTPFFRVPSEVFRTPLFWVLLAIRVSVGAFFRVPSEVFRTPLFWVLLALSWVLLAASVKGRVSVVLSKFPMRSVIRGAS